MQAPRIADGAGVAGAIFAALCCAGVPVVVGALSAVGLSFLRSDAILVPLLGLSLAVALWGLAKGRQLHGSNGPLAAGILGGASLVAGVLSAKLLIPLGAALLVGSVVWNIMARRREQPLHALPRG